MDEFKQFFSFSDPNVLLVTLGTVFLGMSAAMVGTFTFLRKRSLVGDAVAHAILPGIALSFIIFQSKNPFILMSGALLSGWIALLLMEHLSSYTKLKPDNSIALVLSVFFGLGILLLTAIQHSGAGNQAGLDQFLFGKAAAMRKSDLMAYAVVAIILLITISLLYKELKLLSFNPDFAQISGLPVRRLKFALSTITVLAISIGIQSVGVVLMAALLITPSAAARVWTNSLWRMMILAGAAGAISGLAGSYISFTAPQMPTGPWIVMCLSFIALFSLFFAPRRGVVSRLIQQRRNRKKILSENLLKTFYLLGERRNEKFFTRSSILRKRSFSPDDWKIALSILLKNYWLIPEGEKWKLSAKGLEEARRVVRLHRLWELYLREKLRLKADHVHPGAETMEHIISPEIEEQLLRELEYPLEDPHQSPIPYRK